MKNSRRTAINTLQIEEKEIYGSREMEDEGNRIDWDIHYTFSSFIYQK